MVPCKYPSTLQLLAAIVMSVLNVLKLVPLNFSASGKIGGLALEDNIFGEVMCLGKWALQAVLYPPQVIPCGIHGMGGGFHGMVDGLHSFGGWIPWNG